MPKYTIPNIFHFVWFGPSLGPCEKTIKIWRKFHPNVVINLWLSKNRTLTKEHTRSEIKKICEQYKITSRYIENENHLGLHNLIIQEVEQDRYWSASDIARFAILNKEPGFYFDIDVLPNKALPNRIDCPHGLLLNIVNAENTTPSHTFVIYYNVFCSAYPHHPFFQQTLKLIRANFKFLKANPNQEKHFYTELMNHSTLFYPELTKKQQTDYLFARIVTGSTAQQVLWKNHIYEKGNELAVRISEFSFTYQSYLEMPSPKLLYETFLTEASYLRLSGHIDLQILTQLAQKINHPLATKLNTIYKLDADDPEKFFCLQPIDLENVAFLLARLSQSQDRLSKRMVSIQSKIGGEIILLGKNRYFMFHYPNVPEEVNKIQTLIDELPTDDESPVSQKTVFKP